MNSWNLTYSLLQYRHSLVLDEKVNIGLLFYFRDSKKFHFLFPHSLARVSRLYPDFQTSLIRKYLKGFSEKAKEISHSEIKIRDQKDFENALQEHFILKDSSALFFGRVHKTFSQSPEQTEKKLWHLYFLSNENNVDSSFQSDKQIALESKNSLVVREPEPSSLDELSGLKDATKITEYLSNYCQFKEEFRQKIRTNILLKGIIPGYEETFKFGWQNGSLNLLTPITFDLNNQKSIQDKASLWYGKLNLLAETARKENYRFDLLVSKPRKNNLLEEYGQGLEVLERSNAPLRIIEEEQFKSYFKEMMGTLECG